MREKPLFALISEPDQLAASVASWQTQTIAEKRQKAHWDAKVLMLKGQLPEAISKLTMAVSQFGPHIGLRSDLATCYYLIGMPFLFDKIIQEIKGDVLTFQSRLHPINQARSALMVGKLFEEAGFLHCTYELYQETLSLLEGEIANPVWIYEYQNLYNRIFAQVLRFNSQYGFFQEATRAYAQLSRAHQQKVLSKTGDEVLHALYLYSLTQTSKSRVEDLKRDSELMTEATRILSFYELMEFEIRKGSERTLMASLDVASAQCEYDQIVKAIYVGDSTCQDLLRKSLSSMSRASAIRSLYLFKMTFEQKMDGDLQNILDSHLKFLPAKDQELWAKWAYGYAAEGSALTLTLKASKLKILLNGVEREVDLSKKILIKKFVESFVGTTSCSFEDMVQKMWDKSADASDYDRVRMLVKRVNDLINPQSKVFDFKDLKITSMCSVKELS